MIIKAVIIKVIANKCMPVIPSPNCKTILNALKDPNFVESNIEHEEQQHV